MLILTIQPCFCRLGVQYDSYFDNATEISIKTPTGSIQSHYMNCMQDLCFQTAKPPQSQGHFEQQAGIDVRRVLCLVAVISAIPLLPPFTPWRYAISSYLCICANQLHAPWADTHRVCTGIECNRLKYPQNIARNAVLGFSSFLIVCLGRCLHQSVFPLTVECRVSGQRG